MKAKICIVVASPITLQTLIAPHLAALKTRYELTVVANLADHGALSFGSGVRLVPLRIERQIAPMRDLAALVRLSRLFRQSSFAAVQSVTPKAGLLAMVAAFLSRVPVRLHIFTGQVWYTREGPGRWFLKQMDRVTAWCATHVLVDSPSQRDFLLLQGVVRADKCQVLGKGSIAGVDASRFKPDPEARVRVRARQGYRADSIVFLYIGRVNRDKGVLDLAAAFSRVSANDERLRLLVVGPDEGGMHAAMRASLGTAATRADFLSYTDRPEEHMAGADVICLPSYREGFGVVVIEAGACGLPAIGTNIYGITDAIEDGVTGLLFEPGDVEALAACMNRLAREPDLGMAMGQRARARVLRDFPADAVVGELMRLYAAAIR